MEVDERAKEIATTRYALPPCLHIPIAAVNEDAIARYIGKIVEVLIAATPNMALLVQPRMPPEIDSRLPIWQLQEAGILHYPRQVWVHVNYSGYRRAYSRAFPNNPLTDLVLDHVLNRRVACLKGFDYLRIIPVSRATNSSSGGLSEKWSADYHGTPEMKKKNLERPTFIQYADLADIVKMLNLKTGGALQDPVNDAQKLVRVLF